MKRGIVLTVTLIGAAAMLMGCPPEPPVPPETQADLTIVDIKGIEWEWTQMLPVLVVDGVAQRDPATGVYELAPLDEGNFRPAALLSGSITIKNEGDGPVSESFFTGQSQYKICVNWENYPGANDVDGAGDPIDPARPRAMPILRPDAMDAFPRGAYETYALFETIDIPAGGMVTVDFVVPFYPENANNIYEFAKALDENTTDGEIELQFFVDSNRQTQADGSLAYVGDGAVDESDEDNNDTTVAFSVSEPKDDE